MNNYFAKNLNVGDFVAFSGGGRLYAGIFAGYGKGTIRFYYPTAVMMYKNQSRPRPGYAYHTPYKIIKINLDDIAHEEAVKLLEAHEILKSKGVI